MTSLWGPDSGSLKESYDVLVKSLDSVALSAQRSEDAVFIDDISLRLKLWGSNVRVGDGVLEWADQLDSLRGPLLDIFHAFMDQCTRFEEATKDKASTSAPRIKDTSLAEIKKALLKSVESLATFVSALKTADAVPKSQRSLSTSEKINKRPLPKSAKSAWFLLRNLDIPSDGPQILGAIVSDFEHPLSDFFPSDGKQLKLDPGPVIVSSTQNDFSLSIPTSTSSSLNSAFSSTGLSTNSTQSTSVGLFSATRHEREAHATIPVGAVVGSGIPIDLTTNFSAGKTFERSSSARLQFSGPSVVTTQSLTNVAEYFQRFQREYHDALKEMLLRRRSCYLVVGVKKAVPAPLTGQSFVFAVKYSKIRRGFFEREIKLEPFNKGGLF